MILSFRTVWKGTSRRTYFVEKILGQMKPPKIHTIREDLKERWKVGMTIQFSTGVRTKFYAKFFDGTVKAVQQLYMRLDAENGLLIAVVGDGSELRWLSTDRIKELAQNDGFDTEEEFYGWFVPVVLKKGGVYTCRLIHWTDKLY